MALPYFVASLRPFSTNPAAVHSVFVSEAKTSIVGAIVVVIVIVIVTIFTNTARLLTIVSQLLAIPVLSASLDGFLRDPRAILPRLVLESEIEVV